MCRAKVQRSPTGKCAGDMNVAEAYAQPEARVTKRGIFGWMMFDWAAQPFFTVVITFVFGP